jgi:hypothetical protein
LLGTIQRVLKRFANQVSYHFNMKTPNYLAVATLVTFSALITGCAVDPEPVPDTTHFERHQRGEHVNEADQSLAAAKIQSIPIGTAPAVEQTRTTTTTTRTRAVRSAQ